jgi:hypothetical protein
MCQRECGSAPMRACDRALVCLSVNAHVHMRLWTQVDQQDSCIVAASPKRNTPSTRTAGLSGRSCPVSGASPERPEWTVRCGVPVSSEDAKVADANHLRVHLIDICVHVCEHEA